MEESQSLPDSNEERLLALARKAAACTACGLSETRAHVVFGEGSPNAPLALVGEGPGQQEDATGRPFVGRAGILLDECLRACGMTRKHVYICNIIKCRASVVDAGRVQNRPPRPEEVEACSRWLDEQLGILRPLVIVCLGAPAAGALIHRGFSIMRERGQWFTTCRYARYATAAIHPAYILRQEGAAYQRLRQLLIDDIESARRKVIEARKEPPATLF